nr:MAG TPA: hypothetical protein [Caudoviricetes sp.]
MGKSSKNILFSQLFFKFIFHLFILLIYIYAFKSHYNRF